MSHCECCLNMKLCRLCNIGKALMKRIVNQRSKSYNDKTKKVLHYVANKESMSINIFKEKEIYRMEV